MISNNVMKYSLATAMLLSLASVHTAGAAPETAAKSSQPETIKSYCLDFNWAGPKGHFAKAGTWKDADPKAHVAWHKAVGSNVIQTFCVSSNGWAWYKGGPVPEQPGLKHDFLREVVKLGHKEGMQVMGYFCIGANTRWGQENPEPPTEPPALITCLIPTNTSPISPPPSGTPLKPPASTAL